MIKVVVIDYEPATVKVGRTFNRKRGYETHPAIVGRSSRHRVGHRACYKERMEIIAYYKGSSQAQACLKDRCEGITI